MYATESYTLEMQTVIRDPWPESVSHKCITLVRDIDLTGGNAIKCYRCQDKHSVEVQRREWLDCPLGLGGRKGQRLGQLGRVL